MRLARILGAIGRGLISAGVIVLLFVAYQLWGTGLQHSAAQSNLGNEFAESTGIEIEVDGASDVDALLAAAAESQEDIDAGQILAAEPETTVEVETELVDVDGDGEAETVAQTDAVVTNFEPAEREAILAKLYPEAGEAFARVFIPAINVDQISVAGVSVEDLRKGPGHYTSTPNPGQAGNAAIAGHRTTYGAPFHRVDELVPGNDIFVTTAQGTFQYKVIGFDDAGREIPRTETGDIADRGLGYFIVSPSDTWVLDSKPGQNRLTLTACHPKYSARQRIIVQAELVGEPAATIPREEAVDLEVSLDSGATDERAQDAEAVDGDSGDSGDNGEDVPEEEQVVIGDDVAADDDPTVDADGNPIAQDAAADEVAEEPEATADESGDEPVDVTTAATADDDGTSGSEAVELASTDAALTADDDFGEGLNGDRTKIRPAIMWGIAALFVWLAAWFMGKQFERKWTLYAVGVVPFFVVLWSAFVNIDQALPSY